MYCIVKKLFLFLMLYKKINKNKLFFDTNFRVSVIVYRYGEQKF